MSAALFLLASVAIRLAPAPSEALEESAEVAEPTTSDENAASADDARALQVVLASCEAALGPGECEAAAVEPAGTAPTPKDSVAQEGDGAEPPWQATIFFHESHVVITLFIEGTGRERRLDFLPADGRKQRYVAAGLLVAAMTAAAERDQAQDAQTKAPPPPQRAPPSPPAPLATPAPMTPPSRALWDAAASVTLGPLAAWDEPSLGGQLNARLWGWTKWGISVGAGANTSLGEGPHWSSFLAALGPVWEWTRPSHPISASVAAQGLAEVLWVHGVPGAEGTKAAVRGGGRLSLWLTPGQVKEPSSLRPHLGLWGDVLVPPVEVELDETRIGRALAWRAGLLLGVSLRRTR